MKPEDLALAHAMVAAEREDAASSSSVAGRNGTTDAAGCSTSSSTQRDDGSPAPLKKTAVTKLLDKTQQFR